MSGNPEDTPEIPDNMYDALVGFALRNNPEYADRQRRDSQESVDRHPSGSPAAQAKKAVADARLRSEIRAATVRDAETEMAEVRRIKAGIALEQVIERNNDPLGIPLPTEPPDLDPDEQEPELRYPDA